MIFFQKVLEGGATYRTAELCAVDAKPALSLSALAAILSPTMEKDTVIDLL